MNFIVTRKSDGAEVIRYSAAMAQEVNGFDLIDYDHVEYFPDEPVPVPTSRVLTKLEYLRRFTTPELFASLRMDLQERGPSGQHTDVAKIEADVLDVANEADRQIVSVRFRGDVVEEKGAVPVAFDEIWHLVKPHDDSRPWAIAGIEQAN